MMRVSSPSVAAVDSADLAKWLTGAGLLATLSYLLMSGQTSILVTAVFVVALAAIAATHRVTAVLMTLAYLFLLGDIRRAVTYIAGPAQPDPLLLVGPLLTIVVAVPILIYSDVSGAVTKALLGVLAVMAIQVFNPLQGGTAIGLSGILFYIVPVLWFWIGRQYASPAVVETFLYRVLFPFAVVAALVGLWQTFAGFLGYQQAWIDSVSREYSSLHLGGSIRAFGFSTSAAEYGILLLLAAVGITAACLSGRTAWGVALPLLLTALVLASGRTMLLRLVITLAIVWSLRHRTAPRWTGIVRALIYAIAGVVLVGFIATRMLESDGGKYGNGAARDAIVHQARGLANPLDSRHSTATLHLDMLVSAIADGFAVPFGHGLGSTTLASAKFGGEAVTHSSEIDFGDSFVSLGLIGGLLYLVVVALVIRSAFVYIARAPRVVALPVLAILVATVGAWLIGGQYAISCVAFFLMGAVAHVEERPEVR